MVPVTFARSLARQSHANALNVVARAAARRTQERQIASVNRELKLPRRDAEKAAARGLFA